MNREPFVKVLASLAAAISLLERGGKKAAPSDLMFEQMLADYRNALEVGRAALSQQAEPVATIYPCWWVPAPAQDEREAFEAFQSQRPSHWRITNRAAWEAALKYAAENYRPAQTEQQPVGYQFQDREGVWKQFMSEKHYEDTLADGTWPIRAIYAAPIAQTAPLPPECTDERHHERYRTGWNACRKAFLEGWAAPKSHCEWCAGAGHDPYGDKCEHCASAPQPEHSELVEALRSFVNLSEQRLHALGELSPEMMDCLRKGRAALAVQGADHD